MRISLGEEPEINSQREGLLIAFNKCLYNLQEIGR